ncbi:DUF3761 domain-containing protein [Caballeronia novacaledonica]|uniref:DUF3761 domain-containing protein n=1 Tax=Caballeronia novacaledonica TaxID=1544861 RepID=A0AA37MV75_9BURK|nr:DUF3761 domain-containing protein [Caballeronia novacaledonica]GJH30224.1 DUF3761 domain-containing protein [Caballeronia novacaledonica]
MKRHASMSVLRAFAVTALIAASVVCPPSAFAYRGNHYQYQPQPDESDLDNHGHYVNHDGNVIHSPAHTRSGTVPTGATAQCRDGSYSFSQHHSGTCSRHGGVASWE